MLVAAVLTVPLRLSAQSAHCSQPPFDYADRGSPSIRNVALTFDDGPSAVTHRLITTLQRNHATATFFVLGHRAKRHRDVIARIAATGNEIGNHTYTHRVLLKGKAPVARELRATNAVLRKVTGARPYLFRAPRGVVTPHVTDAVRRAAMMSVGWDLDSRDWTPRGSRPARIFARVASRIHPGAIVLMHDGSPSAHATADALPRILRMLRNRGYGTVTVSDLLAPACADPGRKG